ncbi:hypothetical protein AMATHDRAFT_1499 [Amanita thiersii Skay4041]|uniref:XLF-like N-terminal domain-containing protein n=1 Tax=Amanita thiersii Skay4041 TaxID=703135 RepID=A0A2A9NYM8_9AGAR|nr:hypothetical protein AMATHDRAFT_1499 [Amanita thiersii Skay4041]
MSPQSHTYLFVYLNSITNGQTSLPSPSTFVPVKFYVSTIDLSCVLMITDTKLVWAEALSSHQFARRWRHCNPHSSPEFSNPEDEDSWRTSHLELLTKAHTLGAVADLYFQVVQSDYSDFAFQLEYDRFKWRWETCFIGPKRSAEVISKHIIFPLISLSHMAFSSSEALNGMSDEDVEKAVDKAGRTARRSVDTHIKNALSKPRLATTIRRMSAVYNFTPDLPPVNSTAETPDLNLPEPRRKIPAARSPSDFHMLSPKPNTSEFDKPTVPSSENKDSETEPEPDVEPIQVKDTLFTESPRTASPFRRASRSPKLSGIQPFSRTHTPAPGPSRASETADSSHSSQERLVKKHKGSVAAEGEDDESDTGQQKHLGQSKDGSESVHVKRLVRQPIKRGGKRF